MFPHLKLRINQIIQEVHFELRFVKHCMMYHLLHAVQSLKMLIFLDQNVIKLDCMPLDKEVMSS